MRSEGLFWENYSVYRKAADLLEVGQVLSALFFAPSLSPLFSDLKIKCVKGLFLLLETLAAKDIRRR